MAVIGLGTDIIEIGRIEKQTEGGDRLARRILTDNEFTQFAAHRFPARFLAKRFAAKEAAVKALGTGIGNGIGFQQVEVCNKPSGQPYLVFSGNALEECVSQGITSSHLSISDEQSYAVATVILES